MGDTGICPACPVAADAGGAATGAKPMAVDHLMVDTTAASPMARNSPAPSLDDSPM